MSHVSSTVASLVLAAGVAAQTVLPMPSSGTLLPGPNVVYHAGFVIVPAGQTLTMPPGTIVKFAANGGIRGDGVLQVGGVGAPVILTARADGSAGGPTAPGAPVPGDWLGIIIRQGAMRNTQIRFAGFGSPFVGSASLEVGSTGPVSIENVLLDRCLNDGLDVADAAQCSIDGLSIVDLAGGHAVQSPLSQIPNYSGLAVTGGGARTAIALKSTTAAGSPTIGTANTINGNGALRGRIFVPAGETLTLGPGIVFKDFVTAFDFGQVDGTLLCQGTASAPVVFTSDHDDAFGGDTNANGNATAPSPGDWAFIRFNDGSDGSVLDHTIVRFGGNANSPVILLSQCDATFRDFTLEGSQARGLDFGHGSFPTMTRCTFQGNGVGSGLEVMDDCPVGAVPNFSGWTMTGNEFDYLVVEAGTGQPGLPGDAVITPSNYPGETLVFKTTQPIPSGASLTLRPGVICKFQGGGFSVDPDGALDVLGTAREPVVLTSFRDDGVGGDTNENGSANVPATGDWSGIARSAGASTQAWTIEHLLVRFAGTGVSSGSADPSLLTIRSVRAEHCGVGARLRGVAAPADNFVAVDCATGLFLGSGTFDVRHATVTRCTTRGIREFGGNWTGQLRNAIVFGNPQGIDPSIPVSQVFDSNVDNVSYAGQNGNISVDPLFVDASNGDLSLLAGSPCIASADFATALATVTDHVEAPRILDDALVGTALPDMGAYERAAYVLEMTGQSQLGTQITLDVTGPPGTVVYAAGIQDATLFVDPLGFLLAGDLGTILILGTFPVGVSVPIQLPAPDPLLEGVEIAVQGVAFANAPLGTGGFTNLYRAVFFN